MFFRVIKHLLLGERSTTCGSLSNSCNPLRSKRASRITRQTPMAATGSPSLASSASLSTPELLPLAVPAATMLTASRPSRPRRRWLLTSRPAWWRATPASRCRRHDGPGSC
uniref:Uncharacterized protein n=1 Tax=Arundo donax TaxID=35708 RepID=A0A0A9DE92_ARUDO